MLLEAEDRSRRLIQMAATTVAAGLALAALLALPPRDWMYLGAAVGMLVVTAALVKQRWVVEYGEHRVRFENNMLTAEKLFIEDQLVARGGFGKHMRLSAPIPDSAAGERITAVVEAGLLRFRCTIGVERPKDDGR